MLDVKTVELASDIYRESYLVDGASFPNIFISAVAYPPKSYSGSEKYGVGYAEIVSDITEKKLAVSLKTNEKTYRNEGIVEGNAVLRDAA